MAKTKATTKRNKKGRPENWEIGIIKGMLEKFPRTEMSHQDILAFFTRPTRSLNHRVIGEIGRNATYTKGIARANDAEVDLFIKNWPHIDSVTGLSVADDELVIKSREAMLLAVQSFNNPKTYFRSEVFIVLAIIAWTYLMHAFYKDRKVDYRQKYKRDGKTYIKKTKYGAERYWEISECLDHNGCPLEKEIKDNIIFLSEIRDEVEHRMTTRIDKELSFKFQLCCIHYNSVIKKFFGDKLGLDKELSIALQFSAFNTGQNNILVMDKALPKNIQAVWDTHKNDSSLITEAQEVGFFFKRVIRNHPNQAEEIIEFIPADGSETSKNNQYIQYVERKKYRPNDIVKIMQDEGYAWFRQHEHTRLWKDLDAKNPSKGFGTTTLGTWAWYENWLDIVRQHCKQKAGGELIG